MATTQPAAAERFQAGQAYCCRSIGDSTRIHRYVVTRRTATTVWIRDLGPFADPNSKERARRVGVYQGVETVLPDGSYANCPVLRADRVVLVTGGRV